jgi:hypothetical protein
MPKWLRWISLFPSMALLSIRGILPLSTWKDWLNTAQLNITAAVLGR